MPVHELVIRNATVVTSSEVIQGDVAIEAGRIVSVGETGAGVQELDAQGKYLLPGFVDVHTNGAAGFDLTSGLFDPETGTFRRGKSAYWAGLRRAADFLLRRGVTSALLTTVSAPIGRLEAALRWFAEFCSSEADHPFLGVFVEGTFIKDPAYRGAQNSRYFRPADLGVYRRLQGAARGVIRMLNVPPEHGAQGCELIRQATQDGVVCVAGHTGASYAEFRAAIRSGLRGAVHFLNGPTGSSPKGLDEGGAVEAILRSPELFVPLILDGVHVHPAYVRDTLARVGLERFVAVTDGMFAIGLTGVDRFVLSGVRARVAPGNAYLYVEDDPQTLCGSLLTMDKALANLLTWLTRPMDGVWHRRHEALPFEVALRVAVAACSTNPARFLRMDGEIGDIAVGKRADLILAELREEPEGWKVRVDTTIRGGG